MATIEQKRAAAIALIRAWKQREQALEALENATSLYESAVVEYGDATSMSDHTIKPLSVEDVLILPNGEEWYERKLRDRFILQPLETLD